MNTHLLALQLMAFQGCLGAFDTLYHHELTEALPQRISAKRELSIHAARALIYSALFIGLAGWVWHGTWALVLVSVFGVELVLTLWDFVVEDQTRLLPSSERITHTVLAINGGAIIALLVLNTPEWLSFSTELSWQPHGLLSAFLALCGIGVGISGVRDAVAAYSLGKRRNSNASIPGIHFSDTSQSILVTGATGFIGQHLVRALLADSQQVTVLTRHPKQAAWLFGGQVRCIASMSDVPESYRIDVVINLAGARILGWPWTEARRSVLRKSRIGLTQNVVAWIGKAKYKPRLMLSASAIGYYGIQTQGDENSLTESSAPQPIFMSQLCQDWEAAAQAARAHGVLVACMRFGVVFGTQGALPIMLLPIKLGLGGRLGSGLQYVTWIHIQDVLRGMAHLWKLSEPQGDRAIEMLVQEDDQNAAKVDGAYNFTAPNSVPQWQFSSIAAQLMHRPCFFPTPAFPMRLALGEQAELLLEGQRAVPARLQAIGFVFRYPDLKSTLQSLR